MSRDRGLRVPSAPDIGFSPVHMIELTEAELRLVRAALTSYLEDFGHDEADLLRAIKEILGRLPEPAEQEL